MNLKKINPKLQETLAINGILEPTNIQLESFSTLKSGADVFLIEPEPTGKSTLIAITLIQKLEKAIGESTRALVFVKDKTKVQEMVEMLNNFGKHTNLRVIGVSDYTDIDEEKNEISAGMDILVGTPNKINAMFSSAGFNMNTIKMFIVDDADLLFKNRFDTIILRLSMSVEKTQRIFFASNLIEKLYNFIENQLIEPTYFGVDFVED